MIDEKIKVILSRRCQLQNEDFYGIEKCWIDVVDVMSEDMEDFIEYLLNRCTANELSWLGESFEYVAKAAQSDAFISCLYELAEKEPVINQYGFLDFIDSEE